MTAVAGVRRLLGQVIAVRDLDTAVDSFERLGLVLSDRFTRKDIGLDTATFGFDGGSYLELVTPVDRGQVVGATVAAFMDNRGEGPYLTCFEVDDVHKAHERLLDAGIPVVGPPQAPPAERGIACDVLWLKPRATAGAFMQLLSFREPGYEEERRTPGVRLLTHAISVADMGSAVAAFERLGFEPWAQYQTERWGLDTTVFRLSDGTNLELVSPTDTSRPAAEAVAKAVRRRGGHGHYMTVFETDDVTDVAKRLDAVGVPTLGPPEPAPAESPWGPCQQLWVHPRATHGAFIEFLTMPDDE